MVHPSWLESIQRKKLAQEHTIDFQFSPVSSLPVAREVHFRGYDTGLAMMQGFSLLTLMLGQTPEFKA